MIWRSSLVLNTIVLSLLLAAPAAAIDAIRVEEGTIRYQVDHRLKSFEAVMAATDAQLLVQWPREDLSELRMFAAIPLAAFDSGNQLRDEHAAEVLELWSIPEAIWIVETVEILDRQPESGPLRSAELRLQGPLQLHGITTAVTIDVELQVTEGQVSALAQFPLSLTDYGIERPGLLGFRIEDSVVVTVELSFTVDARRPENPTYEEVSP